MRSFYSEYVRHCLRYYSRFPQADDSFKSEIDKKNWQACKEALESFSSKDRETLLTIFREGDTIPDNVYQMAKKLDVHQNTIWKLIAVLEKKIAKRRELI